jgi:hypothetical protein
LSRYFSIHGVISRIFIFLLPSILYPNREANTVPPSGCT